MAQIKRKSTKLITINACFSRPNQTIPQEDNQLTKVNLALTQN
jgi:hypothetical protein